MIPHKMFVSSHPDIDLDDLGHRSKWIVGFRESCTQDFCTLERVIDDTIGLHRFLKEERVMTHIPESDCKDSAVLRAIAKLYNLVGWDVTIFGPVDELGYSRMVFILE